jgi:hypothetical protein
VRVVGRRLLTVPKSTLVALLAAIALATVTVRAQQADQKSAVYELDCDRACLLGVLKGYMDALRSRSPSAAPVSDNVIFTENNVVITHGKGLWTTVDKVDAVGLEVADTETQNAAWFGSVVENAQPVIYAVRIHVRDDGRIDEVESVVHRLAELPTPFGNTKNLVHDPEFNQVLAPEKRRPRARLRAIADSYFDTVELNDGLVFAPFADDCHRIEDAMKTASTDRSQSKGADFVNGCEAQFRLGYFKINKRVRERRYPIIDEERGVVVATGFFDHANEWDRFRLTDGREMLTWLKWPNTITLLEAFRINDAKIESVEAIFTYVPYFMHNPWSGQASNPPTPVSSPKACDTACLTGLAGKVMSGYINRGTWKTLPWARKVGYVENSVGMQVNEGIWGSTTGIDEHPLVIADPQLGHVLWLGRIDENAQPAWAAVIVSADGDRIGGIDAMIRRKEYRGPYAVPKTAPTFADVPAAQRTSRFDMLMAADRYYRSVSSRSRIAPNGLASSCQLTVNGQPISSCAMQFTDALRQGLEQVRDRDVIAVDETRGFVAVRAYEDYPATVQEFADATGKSYKDMVPFPRTLQVVDLFRFEKGSITRIDSFTSELIYGMKPR